MTTSETTKSAHISPGTKYGLLDEELSPVVRSWVIAVQDRMPTSIRESVEWRDAAAGIRSCTAITREGEKARAEVILDWMWGVLGDPDVELAVPAQAREAWDRMVTTRTPTSADDAASSVDAAAYAAYAAYDADDADAAALADDAAYAAYATYDAARSAALAVARDAAEAVHDAAEAVRAASTANEVRAVWGRHNPARVLTALTTR